VSSYARELKAERRVSVVAELDATFPLLADEEVEVQGAAALRRGRMSDKPCFLRLSERRLCLVEHFFFLADWATEVPPDAVRSVELHG
jgi:hypothetical protein